MGKVVFLGVEGSGKTTLAMALAKAFARHADEGWYLRPEGRGAYNFATVAPNDFATDGFPAQTSAAREMTWTIARDGKDVGGIRILDYPGEIYRLAFLAAEDEADPDTFRARAAANAEELDVLNRAIEEAESLYVLFNLQDALNLSGDDANRSAVWVTNECLKRLKALPSKPRVTLVFTQVDRYQTEDDFLHSFTPAELDLIGHDHPDVDWMMVSVLVPPESEFGIDAFVRRVTGLGEFGVPDGRPRTRAGASGALARLAAQRKEEMQNAPAAPKPDAAKPEGEAPAQPKEDAAPQQDPAPKPDAAKPEGEPSAAPKPDAAKPEGESPAKPKRSWGLLWLVLIFAAVLGTAYLAVKLLSGHRALDWGKQRPAAAQDAAATRRDGVAIPPAAAPREARLLGARAELAAETAAALDAARACATPQEARETLSYAAEALDSAEALYELARVDDFLGWGAFVRTREEKERRPPWTAWLRRIDLLGEKKAVFMQRPAANDLACRTQALKSYRAAAARGVSAAVDALARHAAHENEKDVRRSSAAKMGVR